MAGSILRRLSIDFHAVVTRTNALQDIKSMVLKERGMDDA
jgi:hypothetical protein